MLAQSQHYGGGAATCTCGKLPHAEGCPARPFFDEATRLTLDHDENYAPFHLRCPRCTQVFPQDEHILTYEYAPTQGNTEQADLPIVCPRCGHSDKNTSPAIIGHEPGINTDDVGSIGFGIYCPQLHCAWNGDRTDGVLDIWLEKAVVMGVETLKYYGHEYSRGEVYAEYTSLSISCPQCGHSCGEEAD